MTQTRVLAGFLLVLLVLVPSRVAAESVPDLGQPHVRITDGRLRAMFEAGLRSSSTFRALLSRLDESDVVVYLQPDVNAAFGLGGRLTFLSMVKGIRYVVVRVARLHSPIQQVAMIAHELQHAVEVAECPEIVDASSLFREYMRIGYVNGSTGSGVAFDTRAAMEAGARVTDELRESGLVDIAVALAD